MSAEDQEELLEAFKSDVFGLMGVWRGKGIGTRGIASGSDGCSHLKVGGWINAPGSRPIFDQVLDELGSDWTVESVYLQSRYDPLINHSASREKAKQRLDGTTDS